MTKYAKNLTKASILSVALTAFAVSLNIYGKQGNTMEHYAASLFSMTVGIFAVVSVIATIVYLFVEEESN